jgi:RimJ/RimL family protein N-acetyltransferase
VGYGKAALAAVVERIKAQGGCRAIELDYDRYNLPAARLYTGGGFRPVTENEDGEILARLEVDAGGSACSSTADSPAFRRSAASPRHAAVF